MTKRQLAGYLKTRYGLIVGERTLDETHREWQTAAQRMLRINGRSATTGRKKTVRIQPLSGRMPPCR